MPDRIHVVAGVLRDEPGRVLITQRLPGTHMAGRWEFPGGKLQPDEPRREGLVRELKEELGIRVIDCSPLIRFRHDYPDREVLLDFWEVRRHEGHPTGREGQALRWLYISELHTADILEADLPVIDALRLPDCYAITPVPPVDLPDRPRELEAFLQQLADIAAGGIGLIQLRAPGIAGPAMQKLAVATVQAAATAALLVNGDPRVTLPIVLSSGAAGLHVPSRFLSDLASLQIPDGMLVGASCHDAAELALAARAGAHFAVLGPVQATASHPGAPGLGWERFSALADRANLPVYALGGVGPDDADLARASGARGVAGIRAFFNPLY